ncbi:class I SAM-dependent methyltransferase [Streptomyces sp. NBC_01622]|uniref:class I SAM-dependent methyltransferase n=1 Tax=Streptomyces sp. NBC_01622 TaxID=2975903 RepID=UPI00386DE70B|nr:class I SAM-dependent methyltransferase [Streptomyces sp. NBC_01622]
MTTTGERGESAYLLGHSPTELDRLVLQARLYDPITTQALRLAGLSSGMRVLDVGCGAGDVTFAAAAIVGPTGAVTGIDAAPAALELAHARAARRAAEPGREREGVISFREATLPDVTLDEPVDAVIGRLILGHLPDPVTALRRLSRLVRPGGLIAFQDFDNHPLRVVPATPLADAVLQTIAEALTVDGTDLGAGARLYSLFQEAGLPPSGISATTPMGGAEDATILPLVVQTYRALSMAGLPARNRAREAARRVGDPDSLLERMRSEIAETRAVVIMPTAVTVWTVWNGEREESQTAARQPT